MDCTFKLMGESMNSVAAPILPLVLSVVVGEALFVFGKFDEVTGKCFSFPNDLTLCLSPAVYQAALWFCAVLFLVSIVLLARRPVTTPR